MSRPMFRSCVSCGEPAARIAQKAGGLCSRCWWLLDRIGDAQRNGALTYHWKGKSTAAKENPDA